MAWNDERVELLKRLWSEGLSASQIANKMGGVTRNAVIGKVHRLGLSGRATPAKPQRGCALETPVATIVRDTVVEEPRSFEPMITEPEFVAPAILDDGDLTTVSTLTKNMCKWPMGDPAKDDFHFCGQPTSAGKSYCAYHARVAFQPSHRRPEPAKQQPRLAAPNARQRMVG